VTPGQAAGHSNGNKGEINGHGVGLAAPFITRTSMQVPICSQHREHGTRTTNVAQTAIVPRPCRGHHQTRGVADSHPSVLTCTFGSLRVFERRAGSLHTADVRSERCGVLSTAATTTMSSPVADTSSRVVVDSSCHPAGQALSARPVMGGRCLRAYRRSLVR
jgi:hypothetical protein